MSKAIGDIKKIAFNIELNGIRCYGDEFRNIIKELERLEAIDNAKSSEAMECLLDIKSNYKFYAHNNRAIDYQCSIITQALLKSQEQEKVLDKIKQHIKYDKEQMKFTLEIERDDFDFSGDWDNFKEVVKNV